MIRKFDYDRAYLENLKSFYKKKFCTVQCARMYRLQNRIFSSKFRIPKELESLKPKPSKPKSKKVKVEPLRLNSVRTAKPNMKTEILQMMKTKPIEYDKYLTSLGEDHPYYK